MKDLQAGAKVVSGRGGSRVSRSRVAESEVELVGRGRMNRVWRVGNTIRRSRGPWSDTTAALLEHLERRGFTAAPRHLGVDEQGRDVLSLLPGTPVGVLRGDGQLEEIGHLLRELHAATADFIPPVESRWRTSLSTAGPGVQVIHRDVAPWNLLEVDGQLSGLVDWDLAGPGRPVEDLAYAAWHVVPLHGELMGDGSTGPVESDRPRRLRVLCDAYGLDAATRVSFLGEVAGMQVRQAASTPSTVTPRRRSCGTTAGSPRRPPVRWAGSAPTASSCRPRLPDSAGVPLLLRWTYPRVRTVGPVFTPDGRSAVLDRLVERARADPRVAGVAKTGSAAAGTADRWSDIDLFLGLIPAAVLSEVIEEWSSWVHGEFHAVHHFDLNGGGATYRAFLLPDGLEIDLGFAPAGAFRPVGGETFGLVFGDPGPDLPAMSPDADHLIGLAWHHVLHGRSAIDRDRPWSAEYWISALRDQVLTLACVRLGLPTAHGKGFDQLPADLTGPVLDALPTGLERPALLRALQAATTALLAELQILDTAARLEPTLRELAALPTARR